MNLKQKLLHGVLVGSLIALLALGLRQMGALNWLENPLWDVRVRLLATPGPATPNIRLILIDQKSLDWALSVNSLKWPWPREMYAPIIDFCRRGGARSVTLDLLLTEPSVFGVADDRALAASMRRFGRCAGAMMLSDDTGSLTGFPDDVHHRFDIPSGLPSLPAPAIPTPDAALFPAGDLAGAFRVLGHISGSDNAEAVIRRTSAFGIFDGSLVPCLGLAAYLAAIPDADVTFENGHLTADGHRIPLDGDGAVILRFRGPTQTHEAVNAAAVIQSELRYRDGDPAPLSPDIFRDAYVFVGVTSPGQLDLKPTPVNRIYPGVEIHATFLDNLLAGDFPRDMSLPWVLLLTLLFCCLAASLGRALQHAYQLVLALCLMIPFPIALGFLYYTYGTWLPVAVLEIGTIVSLVAGILLNYALEGRQKRFLRDAFHQYLSPAVIDDLLRNPNQLALGGEERELSILFMDIEGFTGICELLPPTKLTRMLNEYLTQMTDIILEAGGTIDKFEGDAIIAFWNAPLKQPDHAARAVRAAINCRRALEHLRPALKSRYGIELHTRCGISTGRVVVGNIGSTQRFNYTFLGDAGNIASRIENLNRHVGTSLLVSGETRAACPASIAFREIANVQLLGRRDAVRVFEPLDQAQSANPEFLRDFENALQAYYTGDLEQARATFARLADRDPVSAAYAARCGDLGTAPDDEWDGIWVMKEK